MSQTDANVKPGTKRTGESSKDATHDVECSSGDDCRTVVAKHFPDLVPLTDPIRGHGAAEYCWLLTLPILEFDEKEDEIVSDDALYRLTGLPCDKFTLWVYNKGTSPDPKTVQHAVLIQKSRNTRFELVDPKSHTRYIEDRESGPTQATLVLNEGSSNAIVTDFTGSTYFFDPSFDETGVSALQNTDVQPPQRLHGTAPRSLTLPVRSNNSVASGTRNLRDQLSLN